MRWAIPAKKTTTLWTLRKVSTRISISMPRELIRIYTFRLLWIFCFMNHYFIPLSSRDGMRRPGSVCADCAGWSGSIYYAEAIMLVFSRDGWNTVHFNNVSLADAFWLVCSWWILKTLWQLLVMSNFLLCHNISRSFAYIIFRMCAYWKLVTSVQFAVCSLT